MNKSNGKFVIICLVILLIILHHDVWNWDNKEPVFGFMPMALLWQSGISIGAGVTWFLATRIAWPDFSEDVEEAVVTESTPAQEGAE